MAGKNMTSEQKPSSASSNGAGRGQVPDGRARRSGVPAPGRSPVEPEPAATEPLVFEEALGRLDELVTVLEEGRTPLEEALALYEEGVRMAEYCQRMLDEAQLRLQRLAVNEEDDKAGSFVLESFMLDEDV
jgi:exodeoxyribonuclease VII small subunit